jgi:hypothetical protein
MTEGASAPSPQALTLPARILARARVRAARFAVSLRQTTVLTGFGRGEVLLRAPLSGRTPPRDWWNAKALTPSTFRRYRPRLGGPVASESRGALRLRPAAAGQRGVQSESAEEQLRCDRKDRRPRPPNRGSSVTSLRAISVSTRPSESTPRIGWMSARVTGCRMPMYPATWGATTL